MTVQGFEQAARPSSGRIELETGPARAVFDLEAGARLASLTVAGHELLVGHHPDVMRWGSYAMVPWAGRVRHGRFRFDGAVHQLRCQLPPHAIHGTAYDTRWQLGDGVGDGVMVLDPVPHWPFPARAEQRARLMPDRLRLELSLVSTAPPGGPDMPAMLGWHPWFRREIDGVAAELDLEVDRLYQLDHEAIPTGLLTAPGPLPWDDCVTGLRRGPTLRWPGRVELDLRSSCDHWVVYTHPDDALCVEPQSDAPDVFNRRPRRLAPGQALEAWFELIWRIDP